MTYAIDDEHKSRLPSDDLIKIAHGATLGEKILMINNGFASQRLAIPKVMSWRLNLGRHSLRNLSRQGWQWPEHW